MTSRRIPEGIDPVHPAPTTPITIVVDGTSCPGVDGQTIAGVLLGAGRMSWRTTSGTGRPRGLFCGIGVCFDCIATVNGIRDVRLCQRRASDGDQVITQFDQLPAVSGDGPGLDTSLPRFAPPALLDQRGNLALLDPRGSDE